MYSLSIKWLLFCGAKSSHMMNTVCGGLIFADYID